MLFFARIGRVGSVLLQPFCLTCAAQFAAGLWLVGWLMTAQASFGNGLVTRAAMTLVVTAALVVGQQLARRRTPRSLVLPTAIAACSAAFAPLTSIVWSGVTRSVSDGAVPTLSMQLAILIAANAALLLVPMTLVGWQLFAGVSDRDRDRDRSSPVSLPLRLVCLSIGMLTNVVLLAPHWGFETVSLIASGGTAVVVGLAVWRLMSGRGSAVLDSSKDSACSGMLESCPANWTDRLTSMLAAGLSAAALVAASRLCDQLTLPAIWLDCSKWAVLLLGFAIGLWTTNNEQRDRRSLAGIAVATWLIACLAGFQWLVQGSLELNSYVSSVSLLAAARWGCIAMICGPLGTALACWSRSAVMSRDRSSFVLTMSGFGLGLGLTSALGLSLLGVPGVILLAASGFVGLSVCRPSTLARLRNRDGQECPSYAPLFAAAWVLALIAIGPFAARQYDPALAAKLLFDTRVFVAHRIDSRLDILPHLDEGRCLSVTETDNGTFSLWRYRGVQTQLRESGVPKSILSLDTRVCPQSSGDALQAILPLVLHEKPRHLAIIGARSCGVLDTALQFPVQTVTCVESDRGLLAAVRRDVWSQLAHNPAEDDRMNVVSAEAPLALASQPGVFDVIISHADQAAFASSASVMTTEFYQLAARALTADGMFCQRFQFADVGPSAINVLLRTWRSAFTNVSVIETAPGEWLMFATNSDSGIVRPGLIERLQRAHVRMALSQLGWDWATPLQLSVISNQRFDAALADVSDVRNTATNGRLLAWLPWEVMRWGEKSSEVAAKFSPFGRTLGAELGKAGETAEVVRRMEEIKLHRTVIEGSPDQYWAYRKAVKRRLMESPQNQIVQVKGQNPVSELHPNEKRRLRYFELLGAAAKRRSPDADRLQEVVRFTAPYDPLISFFSHQELAELAAKNPSELATFELEHRLHAVYFSSPTDQSVRNVIAAIHLLVEHPEALPDDAQRGDQLDALLQMLHTRWYSRGDVSPATSKVVLNDIEKSLAAVDVARTALDGLRDSRALSEADWSARKAAIDKSLVRPLRNYRSTLLPHHASEQLRGG